LIHAGVHSEIELLTDDERNGRETFEATPEMVAAVNWVWNLLQSFGLTNGKEKPKVLGFMEVMDGGSQTMGYHVLGTDTVCLHKELGGSGILKVALEEVVHYVTGATDGSRDLQDFLFRTIVEIAS
jgi:hypothetical protein